jgi:hypothetical protein
MLGGSRSAAPGRGNLPIFSRCRHMPVGIQSAPETVGECAGRNVCLCEQKATATVSSRAPWITMVKAETPTRSRVGARWGVRRRDPTRHQSNRSGDRKVPARARSRPGCKARTAAFTRGDRVSRCATFCCGSCYVFRTPDDGVSSHTWAALLRPVFLSALLAGLAARGLPLADPARGANRAGAELINVHKSCGAGTRGYMPAGASRQS